MLKSDVLTATPAAPERPLLDLPDQVTVAASISAIEMARLSGIGRERLRTWERRHGFPTPVRAANGMRRYLASDVRRVLAVARLVERGVPLSEAIQGQRDSAEPSALTSLGAALDDAPTPAIALRGPAPLTVAWVNTATAKVPEAIQTGDELLDALPEFGARAVSQIQALLADADCTAVVVEHLDWADPFPTERRSIAWRVSPSASAEAMVVLLRMDDDPSGTDHSAAQVSQRSTWAAAVRAGNDVLQRHSGLSSVQHAVAQVVKATGGIDGFLATRRGETLRTASSVRGQFAPRTVEVGSGGALTESLSTREVRWLASSERDALGAPCRSRVLAVPMVAGGATIGCLCLAYPQELALDDTATELLRAFSTTLATTLQREQFAQRASAAPGTVPAQSATSSTEPRVKRSQASPRWPAGSVQ